MKNLLTRFNATCIAMLSALAINAQMIAHDEPADIDTELSTPAVPNKQAGALTRAMNTRAEALIEQGYNVELMRDDQVIAVTIQLDKLFGPNESGLLKTAPNLLQPFTDFTRHYGNFKLLLAVHSDNTGSEAYRRWLCEQRVMSLYDFFDTHGTTPAMIYGYPMSHEQPLVDDNTRNNRSLNRRLEIFIVPGPQFITNLKSRK